MTENREEGKQLTIFTQASTRLHTPVAHPLEIRISIGEIPTDDDLILATADDPSRVELQLEHPVAALPVVVSRRGWRCLGVSMGVGVELRVSEAMRRVRICGLELRRMGVCWC